MFSNSPSPVKLCTSSSTKGRTNKGKGRKTRSVQSSVSSEGSAEGSFRVAQPPPKMQAEQGSIGELQKYHGRYLKNRRHTLANVRWVSVDSIVLMVVVSRCWKCSFGTCNGNYENEQDVCDVCVIVFIVSALASSTPHFNFGIVYEFWIYFCIIDTLICIQFFSIMYFRLCRINKSFGSKMYSEGKNKISDAV